MIPFTLNQEIIYSGITEHISSDGVVVSPGDIVKFSHQFINHNDELYFYVRSQNDWYLLFKAFGFPFISLEEHRILTINEIINE